MFSHRAAAAALLRSLSQKRILSGSRKEKEKLLHTFWRTIYKPNVSLFPLMRLLLPQLDSDRPTYGLRESSLADAYIHALGLNKTLDQAMRLKNYKTPFRAGGGPHHVGGDGGGGGVSGDFALVLADVLRRYVSVPEGVSKLTIADINTLLDQLASDKDRGSAVRTAVFAKCVAQMSPLENMWFTRIITKGQQREQTELRIARHRSENECTASHSLAPLFSCSLSFPLPQT